jgi:hypothetical protein
MAMKAIKPGAAAIRKASNKRFRFLHQNTKFTNKAHILANRFPSQSSVRSTGQSCIRINLTHRVSEFQTTARQTCHALISAPYAIRTCAPTNHTPALLHIQTPLPFRSGPAAVQTQWVRICSFSEVLGFQALSELVFASSVKGHRVVGPRGGGKCETQLTQ